VHEVAAADPADRKLDPVLADLACLRPGQFPAVNGQVQTGPAELVADLAPLAGYTFQDIWCGTNPRPIANAEALVPLLRKAL
jgi:hypothetical protein